MEEIVYLNGSLVPRSQAKLSPFDYGFLYGYGLFETLRAYSGYIFRWEEHLARLHRSTELLGFALPFTISTLKEAAYQTLKANNLSDARLRLSISAGEGEVVPDPSTCQNPTVLITARSYSPPPAQTYEKGFRAIVSRIRRNSQSPFSQIKSANYGENLLARKEAKDTGAEESLLLNEKGFLAEGSTANIFLVSRFRLLTPEVDCGILPGVTRSIVLGLAPSLGIEAVEGRITLPELLTAEEAFLTNSLLEIMPLTRVEEQAIGSGSAGEVTRKLRQAYAALVAESMSY